MPDKVSFRKRVFDCNCQQTMEYIDGNELSNFPGDCKKARRLSNWMHRQFKRTNVPEDEKVKLDVLRQHFNDKPQRTVQDEHWNHFLHELQKYKEECHTFVMSKKLVVLLSKRRRKLIEIGFLKEG